MISTIIVTGRLGGKPTVVNGTKKNFLAFSLAVLGEENMWLNCTWSFNGNQPPKVLEYLDTGKLVLIEGRPYAKLMPEKDQYPARALLCIGVNSLELLGGKDREIKGSQEQPGADPEIEPDNSPAENA